MLEPGGSSPSGGSMVPPRLQRSNTVPAGHSGSGATPHGRSFLVERLNKGSQPLSEAMLLHITGDKGAAGSSQALSRAVSIADSVDPASKAQLSPQQEHAQPLKSQPQPEPRERQADEVMKRPFEDLGKNARIVRPKGHADAPIARCEVCFDKKPLPRVCEACPPSTGACAECLSTYFATAVNDALYAVPKILCVRVECRARIETSSWAPFVDAATHEKYLANANALLSLRCPSCDDTSSFFLAWGSDAPIRETEGAVGQERATSKRIAADLRAKMKREELWGELLAARSKAARHARRRQRLALAGSRTMDYVDCSDAAVVARTYSIASGLVDAWLRFRSAEASADELVARMMLAWPPGRGTRPSRSLEKAMEKWLPGCVEDPERRVTLQLAWLRRYPKVVTPCCRARVCFKCKVRGWHRRLSCEERQRREAGREAQFCPNCQVPTTRSDGCDHIRCVCGTEWTWQDKGSGADGDDDSMSGSMDSSNGESSNESRMSEAQHVLRRLSALELAVINSEVRRGKPAEPGTDRMETPSMKALEAILTRVCSGKGRARGSAARPVPPTLPVINTFLAAVSSQEEQKARGNTIDLEDVVVAEVDGEASPEVCESVEVEAQAPATSSSGAPARDDADASAAPEAKADAEEEAKAEAAGAEQQQEKEEEKEVSIQPSALRSAVRACNAAAVQLLLQKGAAFSEEVLWEMMQLPEPQAQEMSDTLEPFVSKLRSRSLPVWARIHLGLDITLGCETVVDALALTALRRVRSRERRDVLEQDLRKHLSDEWYEALQAQAATDELLNALRWSNKHKVEMPRQLFEDLLRLGADPLVREQPDVPDGEEEDEGSDASSNLDARSSSSEEEEDGDDEQEEHDEHSTYWCPCPQDPMSALELVLRSSNGSDLLCQRFLADLDPFNSSASSASAGSADNGGGDSGDKSKASSSTTAADRRRERFLVQAIYCGNLQAVTMVLASWRAGAPIPAPAWLALSYLADEKARLPIEDVIISFIEQNGLAASQVPLWALLQLCADPEASPDASEVRKKMHQEAVTGLAAQLASDLDDIDGSDGLKMGLAVLRARDSAAKALFVETFKEKINDARFNKLRTRAANLELLLELRCALQARRPPDQQKAARLQAEGARATAGSEWGSYEDQWNYGSGNDQTRRALDLLVSNPYGPEPEREAMVREMCRLRANPNGRDGGCAPLQLAVRARNPPAVRSLLECKANLTTKVLDEFQKVSYAPDRHALEDIFVKHFHDNPDTLTLQDTGLWAAVQNGFRNVAQEAISKMPSGAHIEPKVLIALRRCRQEDAKAAMCDMIKQKLEPVTDSEHIPAFEAKQREAATLELHREMLEAFENRREPAEDLVQELLALDADPQARNLGDTDSDIDDYMSEDSLDTRSHNSADSDISRASSDHW